MENQNNCRQKFIHHFAYLNSTIRFPKPFAHFAGKPNAKHDHITFDSMGFRNSTAIKPRDDKDEIRIFVLGGSTMVEGVSNDDTVPGRLEIVLKSHGLTRAKVFNFGVVSTCFAQMSALLWSQLARFDPNAVVVVGGGTDVTNPWTFDPRPSYPYNAFVVEEVYDYLFDSSRMQSRELGLGYDDLTNMLYEKLERLRKECCWKTEGWELAVIQHARDVLDRFSTLASAIQTPILCVLQPTIVRKKHLGSLEQKAGSPDFLAYLDRQYVRLEKIFADLDLNSDSKEFFHVLDLSNKFQNESEDIFYDAAHYVEKGRQIMAENIAYRLSTILSRNRSIKTIRNSSIERLRNMMRLG